MPGVRYILRWDDPEVMKSEIIGKTAGIFGIDRALGGAAPHGRGTGRRRNSGGYRTDCRRGAFTARY